MSHPNEVIIREAYAAFARGDLEGYLQHCTEDITFHVPGRNPVAGDYSRAQFIHPFISRVIQETSGTFQETVVDVFANDVRAVVLAHHRFERNGKRFSYDTAHVYRIQDGKLAEFAEYPADLYQFDAAWNG